MSGSARPAAVDGQGETGSAGPVSPPVDPAPGPAWLPLVPAAVTLLAGLQEIQRPSFSRDETATLAVVHRSFPELVRMLGTVDVVHGAYYALIWVVVRAGGSGELAVRVPSAVALAVAAGLVTALGGRLVSSWAGWPRDWPSPCCPRSAGSPRPREKAPSSHCWPHWPATAWSGRSRRRPPGGAGWSATA